MEKPAEIGGSQPYLLRDSRERPGKREIIFQKCHTLPYSRMKQSALLRMDGFFERLYKCRQEEEKMSEKLKHKDVTLLLQFNDALKMLLTENDLFMDEA